MRRMKRNGGKSEEIRKGSLKKNKMRRKRLTLNYHHYVRCGN
jgi:hypothetical protein